MNVLVACEFSGIVRDAFIARGHRAVSCDLLPSERPGPHVQGDVRPLLRKHAHRFDLLIAFPPCTYLARSGLHWNLRRPERALLTEEALDFVVLLMNAKVPRIALENPKGAISPRIRKPEQIVHPWQFGHDAENTACLWLHGLPLLKPTKLIAPRMVNGLPRWANQRDDSQSAMPDRLSRAADKSRTYKGVARAMAAQWSQP